jgi:hypothetical protein
MITNMSYGIEIVFADVDVTMGTAVPPAAAADAKSVLILFSMMPL